MLVVYIEMSIIELYFLSPLEHGLRRRNRCVRWTRNEGNAQQQWPQI